jgi:hypothetical protein
MTNVIDKKKSATGKLVEINGGVRQGCPLPCTILGNEVDKLKSFQCLWNGWKKEGKPVEVTSHRALVCSCGNWN